MNAEKYPDRLASVRKACKTLANEVGMTRSDLKPNLQTKPDEFLKAADHPADEQLGSMGQRLPFPTLFAFTEPAND